MRVQVEANGSLVEFMAGEHKAIATAVKAAVGSAGNGLKADLRQQIEGAGLGRRLGNTIRRGPVYPQSKPSVEAATMVFTKAPKLINVFDRGATIRSKSGFFLAIPTPEAGARGVSRDSKGRFERLTPGGWERRTGMRLRFVYRRGAPSLLVADNVRLGRSNAAISNVTRRGGIARTRVTGRSTVVIFILVPQVRIQKRIDIDAAAADWASRIPGLIATASA